MIHFSKDVFNFFIKRPNEYLPFYMDYQKLKSIKIKKKYPLVFISMILDGVYYAKRFTTFNINNKYYCKFFVKENK